MKYIQGKMRTVSRFILAYSTRESLDLKDHDACHIRDCPYRACCNPAHLIVCQHVGPLKTEASQKAIPMDAGLSALLLDWRGRCPYNQDTDYVFASPEKDGTQPLWPSSAMSKHIRPAAKRAGIVKHVRWHVFRHSFATLLKGNGEDVKTVQESLRHADSKVTLDTYTQGLMPVKREAQRKVIEAIGPIWTHEPKMTVASA